VEDYMPPSLSEEEAIQLAIEWNELIELSQWEALGVQLRALAIGDYVAPTPPPPPPPPAPLPEPPLG
jgi:hypothetical protein